MYFTDRYLFKAVLTFLLLNQPALDLLSLEDVCATFEGDVPLGGDLTAAYLYRHSIYGELVSAEDLHIQVRLCWIWLKSAGSGLQ